MTARKFKTLFLLVAASLLFGCVQTQHDWGNYSNELYTYYKNPTPDERIELTDELLKIFDRVEKKGAKPPPGLYAEYGTFLFQNKDYLGAITFYEKEKQAWPDSTHFMNSLISSLSKQIEKDEKDNS
jgi:hypothetical protein